MHGRIWTVSNGLSALRILLVYPIILYLSSAEREQCDVVTADKRLKAIGHPQVILLADMP